MADKLSLEKLAVQIGAKSSGSSNDELIKDVTHDSRQAGPGTLFAAIKGATVDGHRFIDDVMRNGAAGVISEFERPDDFEGIWLQVINVRKAMAHAASLVNGDPSHHLDLIGITGTNGKTTTAYLCNAIGNAAGRNSAMLTTVEYRIGEKSLEAVRTTPEATETNRFFREAVEADCKIGVMEASSQAIDLHRCDHLRFRVAVFSNLTQDHLDHHGTMEDYFDAKKKLFDGRLGEKPGASVINIDDKWGEQLVAELKADGQSVITYSQKGAADLKAENIEVSLTEGTKFILRTSDGEREIVSPLVGKPHVYNMLAASAAALELGIDVDDIVTALASCKGAPGRFERVPNKMGLAIVVDYAHTDDALLNTLKTARPLTTGRIITVFGCGGDRDRSKRKPMGLVAAENSDLVFITSDNPRTEDPLAIIAEVELGVKAADTEYHSISDRREAIEKAIAAAKVDDVVIIAGKGHETYQIIGEEKFHFDDREAALEAIQKLNDA